MDPRFKELSFTKEQVKLASDVSLELSIKAVRMYGEVIRQIMDLSEVQELELNQIELGIIFNIEKMKQ